MTKKQEPKFIHSKNMKENRYILSFIIFLLGSLSIHSQTHSDLRTTVEEALVSLKPEHLAIGEIKLDTLLLEKGNKLVVQMNDEFSYLPIIEKDESIEVSQFTLKEVIRQTIFSIADSDSNKLMTGELFEIKNNMLRVVSLDGHRISIRKIALNADVTDKKLVVPGKTLIEISKILSGEAESKVNISYTSNHIVFEFDNTVVVSRLLEGEYFKIDQMLSSDYDTKVRINKKELLNCIDRATLLVKEGDKKPIIINIGDEIMELKIKSQIGSMNEEIMINKEGKDLLIGFNPKFLIDALRVIDDEEVTLYLMNAKAPCFIKDDNETYIYLILPVNFNAAG